MKISSYRKIKPPVINYQAFRYFQISIYYFQDESKANLQAILSFCLDNIYFQAIIHILRLYCYVKIFNFILIHLLVFVLMMLARLEKIN